MAIPSELIMATCDHCKKEIPIGNIDLHYAHCSRNLQKCTICGEMVPKKHADEHFYEAHAPIDCSLCSQTIKREEWTHHNVDTCPQRIVTCEYCEFPLPAVDLLKHQEICGSRTEYCHLCNKYIRLREWTDHENQFHSTGNITAEPSRDGRASEREDAHRRQAAASSQRRILLTIAVTGAAVLIGSFFLQRRANVEQQ